MRIREEAINAELARILQTRRNVPSVPEIITAGGTSRRMPDLAIRPIKNSKLSIYLEAKVGEGTQQRQQAFQQALSHMQAETPHIFASIALCYPEEMRHISNQEELSNKLLSTQNLCFAGITHNDQTYQLWDDGGIDKLSSLIKEIESGDLIHLNRFIHAVNLIAEEMAPGEELDRRLSDALKITAPKKQKMNSKQVLKIAALIWLNAAMMQIKIHDALPQRQQKNFPNIEEIKKEAHQGNALLKQWQAVLDIDYRYIFYPALQALKAVPTQDRSRVTEAFIAQADTLVAVMGKIKLDYAGPLYHRLLATAQNDGSFYTSTEAAKILTELALPARYPKWHKDKVGDLRIIDPACGTGTLLMTALGRIKERVLDASEGVDDSELHKMLVEKCIYGCDINRHAVHLAACMLAFPNPSVDYSQMNLFRFRHGSHGSKVYAGSLEILGLQQYGDDLFPSKEIVKAIDHDGKKASLETGAKFGKEYDIVIMNPPYTRNSLRNQQHEKDHHKAIDEREQAIVNEFRKKDPEASESIRNTSIQTYFPALADRLLRDGDGIMASVIPTTVASGADALPQRTFMAKRFHIETVITTHDPRRKFFSGKTDISESLMVARKGVAPAATKFINLRRNPTSILEARALLNDISKNKIDSWGTSKKWPRKKMLAGNWKPALYYNPALLEFVEKIESFAKSGELRPIGEMARIKPGGRTIAGKCKEAAVGQTPYCSMWNNPASKNKNIMLDPDSSLVCKGKTTESELRELWELRSHFLLPHRVRMTNLRVFAAWSKQKVLGQAWVPVNHKGGGGVKTY